MDKEQKIYEKRSAGGSTENNETTMLSFVRTLIVF